jgi:hypothetical protein
MGSITPEHYQSMISRLEHNKLRAAPVPADAAEIEVGKGGLQEQIIGFCNSQWPKWKCIYARTDKKSTIALGAHDITCFLPDGRVICVELKSKTGKLSAEQSQWAAEMKMLGHTVHVVRSLQEFLCLTKIQ